MQPRENLKKPNDQDSREFRKAILEHLRAVLSDHPEHKLPLLISGNGMMITKPTECTTTKVLIHEKGISIPDTVTIHPAVSAGYFPHDEGQTSTSLHVFCSVTDADIERLGQPILSVDQIPAVRGTINRLMAMAGIGEDPVKELHREVVGTYPERTANDARIMHDAVGKSDEDDPHFCHTRFVVDFDLRSKDRLLGAIETMLRELDKAPEKRR